MSNIQSKPRAQELFNTLGAEMYRQAYRGGMSFSAWLNQQMPQHEYKDGLDGFERMLMMAGIRTTAVPSEGIWPDEFGKFFESPQTRSLIPEWVARVWRRTATGKRGITYSSQDDAIGSVPHPWATDDAGRWTSQLRPAIPISEVIALETPVDSDGYKAYYLTPVTAQQRQARIGEGADIPTFKLAGGDHSVRLHKFGGGIESSYEVLRRQRVNRVELHVARMAVQAEVDKLAAIIDVLVNGDGNSGTAATNYNLTALDSTAVAGTLTLKGWLAFKMKFANPYIVTHILVQEAVALQLAMLNTGSGNVPLVTITDVAGFGQLKPINPGLGDGVLMGWTSDAPTLKIVGFDKRFAVERAFEIGADIVEVERIARNQTESLYMTEVEGYAKFDPGACLTLNVNA